MLERLQDKVSLFWLLQLGGWLAFGLAMGLSRLTMYPAWYMALNKGILTVLGIVFTLGLRGYYRRLRLRKLSIERLIVVIAVCSYLMALPWTASFNVIMEGFHDAWDGRAFGVENWFKLVDGSLYHAFVLLAWSVLYIGIKYYQELQAERERALKAETLAQQAQLRALRYQLNPHFLFNTLNAISTLVVEREHDAAGRMISRLSDFLRLTLESVDMQEVELVEELEFARRYLEIEQIRFGPRLTVRIDVEAEVYSALVPSLLLQPLIENAMQHAIAPSEQGGRLTVMAWRIGPALRLYVGDNGPGLSGREEATGQGIGLANTQARLQALYGEEHRFLIQRRDGGGVAVIIDLPFHTSTMPATRIAAIPASTEMPAS